MSPFGRYCILATMILAGPAAAQDDRHARVTLGFGAALAPGYFGSAGTEPAPAGVVAIEGLGLPGGFTIGSDGKLPTDPGLRLRGAFRFVPERTSSRFPELAGLDDIDPALEFGLGLFHVSDHLRLYGEVRRGFGGHRNWVGEVGLDALMRPTDRLLVSAGPRAYLGDAGFLRRYFGVTADEAGRSGLAPFQPDGGLVSLGFAVTAEYRLAEDWSLLGTLDWRQLQDNAATSPVTGQGSPDQFRARLLVTRTFGFGR